MLRSLESAYGGRASREIRECQCWLIGNRGDGAGWGGRDRTSECRNQNPVPYRLATPQRLKNRWNFSASEDGWLASSAKPLPNLPAAYTIALRGVEMLSRAALPCLGH